LSSSCVLTEQAGLDAGTPIFCLSGRRGLRARLAGDAHALEDRGLGELQTHLTQFLTHEKQATLRAAVARKAFALVGELQLEIEFHLKALRLPLADLEQRMAAFDAAVHGFEAERRTAADLLAGDRIRAFAELEADAERFRIQAREAFEADLDQALARGADAEQTRTALAGTIVRFFDTALEETIAEVGKRLTAALHSHQHRADELIALVQRTAADLLEIPFHASESSEALETRRDPFWVTRARPEVLASIPPGVVDRFLPAATRKVRLRRRLVEQIDGVLLRNVENLRWATRQNLEDTFRRFGADLDERLALSLVATRGAMAAARDRRTQQSASVEAEIESARVAWSGLDEIRKALARI